VYEIPDNYILEEVKKKCPLGGNLSIQRKKNKKPLLSFGHDECIFCQFTFSRYVWRGPQGQQPMIPKDDGYGIMVLALQSREFGFSMKISEAQLQIINEWHTQHNSMYAETESAMKINGKIEKTILKETLVLTYFEYGTGKEGYWNYDHISLQFKNCIDCIQALFPEYGSIWMLDHSCSHD